MGKRVLRKLRNGGEIQVKVGGEVEFWVAEEEEGRQASGGGSLSSET